MDYKECDACGGTGYEDDAFDVGNHFKGVNNKAKAKFDLGGDEDIPCEQILMQVNASKSALHKVRHIIVEGHLEHCVKQAIKEEDADEAISDISSILEYYSRI